MPTKPNHTHNTNSFVLWLAIFLGIILVLLCVVKMWSWYDTTHRLQLPPHSVTVTHSDLTPNEAKIDTTTQSYTVPADQPRLLELPTIRVSGFIQQVGLDQLNVMATPSNINMVGWYNGSVKPGKPGVSIIEGHVHGRYEPAVFYKLHELRPGDDLRITYGDDRRVEFTVIEIAHYDEALTRDHLFEKLPGVEKELVLVTCAGTFNSATATYDKRLLVYAQADSQ